MAPTTVERLESSLAYALASRAHEGQTYKDESYFKRHVLAVVGKVREMGGDHTAVCAAYLHDVVEDTTVSYSTVHNLFSEDVALSVLALTRTTGESYTSYIQELKNHPTAKLVKTADLICNLSEVPAPSLLQRYAVALQELTR